MSNTKSLFYPNPMECMSSYALWRRFLITNPALSIARAKIEFESLLPELHIGTSIKKNCPTCAKHFYHSTVYDLPWVTVCPLHGETLTRRCPKCNNLWPKKLEMRKVECHICGARIPFNQIDIDAIYSKIQFLTRIKSIQMMLHEYQEVPHGTLKPLQEAEWRSNSQNTITENDPLMPSLGAAFTKGYQQDLYHSGIRLKKVYQFEFENLAAYSSSDRPCYIKKDNFIEKQTIAKVRSKLVNLIRFTLKQESYSENIIEVDDEHLLINSNIYVMSFSIWQDLMQRRHSGYRYWDLGCSYIYSGILGGIPLVPSIKRLVSFPNEWAYGPSDDLFDTDEKQYLIEKDIFVLPDSIVRIIYELELWKLFFNVLNFLNDIQLRLRENKTGKIQMPYYWDDDPSSPENSCAVRLGVFENDKNGVSIFIPKQEFQHALGEHDISDYNSCDSMKLEHDLAENEHWFGKLYWLKSSSDSFGNCQL